MIETISLKRAPAAFSPPDWLFEIKWDGFRALAQIEHGRCKLISRNGNEFKSFRSLGESLGTELKHDAVLDGEIICLGPDGKSQFYDLFFRRAELSFIAFDLIRCDGQDYIYAPLIERKQKLRSVLPKESQRIFFCDHVERDGEELFRLACANDLEGIVAKHRFGPYLQAASAVVEDSQSQVFTVGRPREIV